MVLKCFWMECYQCGFPVASVDWTEEFLLPVPHTPVAHAVESSQLETARGAAPVLAMSSKEVLYGYSLRHIYQGVHQNHPTAVQIPVVTCLFCNNQDKSGKADLPGVRGQTELQQGLKATGSKLVLAPMFSSVVWNFFFLFLLMGKGMHFFTSPSSLKSPLKIVYGSIL